MKNNGNGKQPDLFDHAPYQPHSDTSRLAAERLTETGRWKSRKEFVEAYVRSLRDCGTTSGELVSRFGGDSNNWAPALTVLEQEGRVHRLLRTRENPGSGRPAHVYVSPGFARSTDVVLPPHEKRCPHCGGIV